MHAHSPERLSRCGLTTRYVTPLVPAVGGGSVVSLQYGVSVTAYVQPFSVTNAVSAPVAAAGAHS